MMSPIDEFSNRLTNEWLVPFCRHRGYSHEGFNAAGVAKLSPLDAADFMAAVDSGLVHHRDGFFSAPQSKVKEQIFWQGLKSSNPRAVTLWLEPIITIAGLMRLHRDRCWPADQLGMQSTTWAFDLVGYSAKEPRSELLLCEVKKAKSEVDSLIRLMKKHLQSPAHIESEVGGAERNAFKKVLALRTSSSPVFWALGPDGYSYVFDVVRRETGSVDLVPTTESALVHRASHAA